MLILIKMLNIKLGFVMRNKELHDAIIASNAEVVRSIIAQDKGIVNRPLNHDAYGRNIEDTMISLIDDDVLIDGIRPKKENPLHLATIQRNYDMVKLLIAEGALVDGLNYKGETSLHLAIMWRDLDVAKLLIANGADVNAARDNGETPLRIATIMGNSEMVGSLIEAGAVVGDGNNALSHAERVIQGRNASAAGAGIGGGR